MNLRPNWPAAAAAALGLLLGWMLWHVEPVRETAAPAKPLQGGGLVLERAPEAKPPAEVKHAAREAGGKLERSVSVTVRPQAIPKDGGIYADPMTPAGGDLRTPAQPCSCAPVTVDLGLVRMPDESRRVVATSQDGEIIGGVDVPIDAAAAARSLKWAAGATYDPRRREFGAFLDRDFGPLRLGVEVQQRDAGTAVVIRAGVRF